MSRSGREFEIYQYCLVAAESDKVTRVVKGISQKVVDEESVSNLSERQMEVIENSMINISLTKLEE